jgi:Protein of unknown function (DUF2950)
MAMHHSPSFARVFSAGLAAGMLCLVAPDARAQQVFPTPDEAASALAAAVKSGTRRDMLRVLGSGGEDIISSGDEVSDKESRERFTTAYDAKHSIKIEGDKKAVVILGNDDFPFPIPLMKKKAGWEFDTAAGRLEILYRRIGRNELDAIQTSLAFVDAQNEYAEKDRGQGAGVYAQRIVSTTGKKDGLYWPGDDSPLGELAAKASAEGYKVGEGPIPYHGYYYRVLTQQGPNAPGGALSYIVKGKMIGGFALLAYPAEYGNSGVMTFLVNHNGVVYQKDLGDYTLRLVQRMNAFDPDQTWKKVDVAKPCRAGPRLRRIAALAMHLVKLIIGLPDGLPDVLLLCGLLASHLQKKDEAADEQDQTASDQRPTQCHHGVAPLRVLTGAPLECQHQMNHLWILPAPRLEAEFAEDFSHGGILGQDFCD